MHHTHIMEDIDNGNCAICQAGNHGHTTTLPCQHMFHTRRLSYWIHHTIQNNQRDREFNVVVPKCPNCRHAIPDTLIPPALELVAHEQAAAANEDTNESEDTNDTNTNEAPAGEPSAENPLPGA